MQGAQPWSLIRKYDAPHTQKVVILFTDGQNEIGTGGDGVEGSSVDTCCYSAYGRRWDEVKNDPSLKLRATPQETLNHQTTELCAAMMKKGVRIFVVQLHKNPGDLANIFNENGCSYDASHYYLVRDPNLKDIREKFRDIARALSALRLLPKG